MQVSSKAFCLSKKVRVFTVLLIGNTEIRVFCRGHASVKQRRKRNPVVGEGAEKQRKFWAVKRCGMVWQRKAAEAEGSGRG